GFFRECINCRCFGPYFVMRKFSKGNISKVKSAFMGKRSLFNACLIQVCILVGMGTWVSAQNVHSHNDYEHAVPFWTAYSNGLESIEVDIYLKNGVLYVTHEESEIISGRTLELLYLQPIQSTLDLELGKGRNLQLLIDIKSDA